MIFLERASAWFWQRAGRNTAVSPGSLGIFRWLFGLGMLSMEAPWSAWIHRLPRGLFDPPVASPAYFAPGFPGFPTFLLLDALQLVALLCVTIGYRTRWASLAYVFLEIFNSNFRFSFGKLDRDFLPSAAILCLLFSNWGDTHSLDARRAPNQPQRPRIRDDRALALLGVVVAFGMFSAGMPKLVNWVDFDLGTSGFLAWYLSNFYGIGRTHLLAPLVQQVPRVPLELLDYMAPIGELLGFVALLWSRRAWLLWLAAVVAFHLSNDVLLNIWFTSFVFVYLAFVDYEALFPGLRQASRALGTVLGVAAVAITLLQIVLHSTGQGGYLLFVPERLQPVAALYVSIPVSLLAMGLLAVAWKRAPTT